MLLKGIDKVIPFETMVDSYPKVSICIVTYNHEKYIATCLDSILNQKTNFEFEILLGEDDSSDKTREICIEYAEKYPDKIRLFLHTRSNVIFIGGAATGRYNFIYNLQAAKGKYIALCEGDDYWTDPFKLQKQVDFLETNEIYQLCFHSVDCTVNGEFLKTMPSYDIKDSYTVEQLFCPWFIPTCSMVFRNNFTLPEFIYKVASGDIALHFVLAAKGDFFFMKENMGVYRIHPGGVSRTHYGYKKAIAMSRLYHYVDDYFDGKYSDLVFESIKHEIDTHVVKKQLREQKEQHDLAMKHLRRELKISSRIKRKLRSVFAFNKKK